MRHRIATVLAAATIAASGVAVGVTSPPAGAASPGGGNPCQAALDLIDWTWSVIRRTDSELKVNYLVKLQNTTADWYFANCNGPSAT